MPPANDHLPVLVPSRKQKTCIRSFGKKHLPEKETTTVRRTVQPRRIFGEAWKRQLGNCTPAGTRNLVDADLRNAQVIVGHFWSPLNS